MVWLSSLSAKTGRRSLQLRPSALRSSRPASGKLTNGQPDPDDTSPSVVLDDIPHAMADRAWNDLRRFRAALGGAWHGAIGLLYMYYWAGAAALRYKIQRGALALLVASLFLLGLEVVWELWGVGFATHRLALVRALFWLAFFALLFSKRQEWRERKQQFYFPQVAKEVAQLLAKSRAEVASERTLQTLLAIFAKTFEKKGGAQANIALRVHSPALKKDVLKVSYKHPPEADYSNAQELPIGVGGSGYCWMTKTMVYIPRVKYRHGILQTLAEDRPYKGVLDVFHPPAKKPSFRSVLCVPLVVFEECHGVLNFDSIRPNAFSRVDFEQAMFYGLAVAQVLHIRTELAAEAAARASAVGANGE